MKPDSDMVELLHSGTALFLLFETTSSYGLVTDEYDDLGLRNDTVPEMFPLLHITQKSMVLQVRFICLKTMHLLDPR